ncbi:hypothetical protein ACF0H5_019673 [Mactra antiquata]
MINMASKKKTIQGDKIAVAAIDFGTTCTGYAYYLKKDRRQNLLTSINIDQAWDGSAKLGLQAPTTVLMDEKKQFHSFGFEAETKYKSLTLTDDHKGWYYFQYFKMSLYHGQDLSLGMKLTDSEGKTMEAITIFSEAIKYVHGHLLKRLKDALVDEIRPDQISWVITVPAIWRDSAKQFMREAAVKAGISSADLMLALEPECAAIYCKEVALKQKEGVDGVFLSVFNPNEKYLVCDLGGGTVDTTIHVVKANGKLEEIYAATGGDWGGQNVNAAFERLLEEMIGQKSFSLFRDKYANAWIKLQTYFETCKRQFTVKTDKSDIDLPTAFEELCRDRAWREGVEVINGTLRLSKTVMSDLFSVATNQIIRHIERLMEKALLPKHSSILLVGGFSESTIVKQQIRSHFRGSKVIAPESAGSAIIKGSVMFGIDRDIIAARVSPYTYGVHTRRYYNKRIHPAERRNVVKGKEYVENAFCIQIVKGALVYVGSEPKGNTFTIVNSTNGEVFWKVYQSEKENPKFCDDEGTHKIGMLKVVIPETLRNKKISLKVTMTCHGTELEAKACIVDFPNAVVRTNLDFLSRGYALAGDFIEED